MTPSQPSPPFRKPNKRLGGIEVRICGRSIQTEGDVICTLPPNFKHTDHAAIAAGLKGSIYAFLQTADGDVQVWQLVAPQE